MYVIDIWNSKTHRNVGPTWVAGPDLSLQEALEKAKEWVATNPNPEDYQVMYHIVGCL